MLNPDYTKVLDGNVYTTDREFRAIFSNKSSDFRPFIPYKSTLVIDTKSAIPLKKSICMRYLATSCISGSEHFIITPDVPKEHMRTSMTYDPETYVPQLYTEEKIRELVDLARTVHMSAEYTGTMANGGWRFTYHNRSEPCYTGNYHDSNGFYLIERNGTIRMNCLSDQCNTYKILKNKKNITKRLFN